MPKLTNLEDELWSAICEQEKQFILLPNDWPWLVSISGQQLDASIALRSLCDRNDLMRVRRGMYINIHNPPLFQNLIDAMTTGKYQITGQAALFLHNAAPLPKNIDVLVNQSQRNWRYEKHYIFHRRTQDELATTVANKEKAWLDALTHTKWSSSLDLLEKIIPQLDQDILIELVKLSSYQNARRVGYLLQKNIGHTAAQPYLELRGKSHRYPRLHKESVGNKVDPIWAVKI